MPPRDVPPRGNPRGAIISSDNPFSYLARERERIAGPYYGVEERPYVGMRTNLVEIPVASMPPRDVPPRGSFRRSPPRDGPSCASSGSISSRSGVCISTSFEHFFPAADVPAPQTTVLVVVINRLLTVGLNRHGQCDMIKGMIGKDQIMPLLHSQTLEVLDHSHEVKEDASISYEKTTCTLIRVQAPRGSDIPLSYAKLHSHVRRGAQFEHLVQFNMDTLYHMYRSDEMPNHGAIRVQSMDRVMRVLSEHTVHTLNAFFEHGMYARV